MGRRATWTVLLLAIVAAIVWSLRDDDTSPPSGDGAEPAAAPAPAVGGNGGAEVRSQTAAPLRTEVPGATTGLLVAVRWRHDDRPAPGVAIELARGDGEDAGVLEEVGTTDTAGALRLADLEPGWVAVRPRGVDHMEWREIVGGLVAEVEFELDGGTAVEGVVVDRDGNPVGGADVWLSETRQSSRGEVVTRSDAGGRFTVAFVGEGRFIAARAAGHGISLPVAVLPTVAAPVPVRVVLDQEAARVVGEVVGGDGRPLAGATVVIGEFRESGNGVLFLKELGRDSELPVLPPPVHAETGSDGRFVAAACPTGRIAVIAWAPAFGLWLERSEVAAGTENRLHIELRAEAVVTGRVRHADGGVVAGAEVAASPAGVRPDRRAWPHWQVRTGPDGAFEFPNLPAGEVLLEVAHREYGRARDTATLAAGQHLPWDPVLDPGLALRIRVQDGDGRPLRGFSVRINGQIETVDRRGTKRHDFDTRSGRTDAAGRVVFASCSDVPYGVDAIARDAFLAWPSTRLEGAQPGGDEVVLRVDGFAPAASYLCGQVLDHRGAAVGCAAKLTYRRRPTDTAGASRDFALPAKPFHIGPLHAGIYQLRMKVADCAQIFLRDLVVEDGRDLDLGPLIAEPSGSVAASIVDARGEPCAADRVWLVRDGRVEEQLATGRGRPVIFDDVAAGVYVLTAWSEESGLATQRIDVPVGDRREVALRLAPGVPCTFELRIPSVVFGVADLRWLDAAGDLIGREHFEQRSETAGSLQRSLPVGRYRLELRGWMKPAVGAVDFAVTDPMPAPVLLEVREVSREDWRRWRR